MLNTLLQTLFLLSLFSFLSTFSSASSFSFFSFPLRFLIEIIYIDESSLNSTSQGTLQNPFTSLRDTIKSLNGRENIEILLLGDSITINSSLIFNGNITFTIKSLVIFSFILTLFRPEKQPETGYFPMRFEPGAGIVLDNANVTFEGIQIVELDLERNINTSLFTVNRSLLCLNVSFLFSRDNRS